jgi:cytochrome c oxidase cbb3-type subunit I/II
MIRPLRFESIRYGEPSRIEDSIFDHPFQWGSKRTGPDLAREGTTANNNIWHYRHMLNPRDPSPGSNMPAYPHLLTTRVDFSRTRDKFEALRTTGVPYTAAQVEGAATEARAQADTIVADLAHEGARAEPDSELVALIAYLRRLGHPQSPFTRANATPTAAPAAAPAH